MDYKHRGADILEIRVDCFPDEFERILEYVKKVHDSSGFPIIGTIRETDMNSKKRLSMFKRIIPFVDAVDIEVHAEIKNEIIDYACEKIVIISEHDFKETPSDDRLACIVENAKNSGADIVKIAAMANCKEDVIRLLKFTEERDENLVTISMGDIGRVSRIVAPLFGSLYTYAFVKNEVAPAQISLDETARLFRLFYQK